MTFFLEFAEKLEKFLNYIVDLSLLKQLFSNFPKNECLGSGLFSYK